MSYTSSPFSPYLGALKLQFALGTFYKFVALSLMVLYELESIHLDDSNLIYSQNKNKGFYKNFDSIPFKNPTFSFLQLFHNTSISLIPNQFQHIIQMHYQTLTHHSLDLSKLNLIYFFLNLSQKHHHSTLNTTNLTSIQENQGITHEKHKDPTFPPLETYLFLGFSLASLP